MLCLIDLCKVLVLVLVLRCDVADPDKTDTETEAEELAADWVAVDWYNTLEELDSNWSVVDWSRILEELVCDDMTEEVEFGMGSTTDCDIVDVENVKDVVCWADDILCVVNDPLFAAIAAL